MKISFLAAGLDADQSGVDGFDRVNLEVFREDNRPGVEFTVEDQESIIRDPQRPRQIEFELTLEQAYALHRVLGLLIS